MFCFKKNTVQWKQKKYLSVLPIGIVIVSILINFAELPASSTVTLSTCSDTEAAFNTNDFLLPAKDQVTKDNATQGLLDIIYTNRIICKLVTQHLNTPESPITRTLADHFSTLPTEQRTTFLQQVSAYMQTPEHIKTLQQTLASIIDRYLDQASINALTSLFSRHRISHFMKFQQELAKAIANYLLQQNTGQTLSTTTTTEHQQAAASFLSTLLTIRKNENIQLLTMVNTTNLIALATPLCCFYLDRDYLQDLTAFIQTPEGKKVILRYDQIECSMYDALVEWCKEAIQQTNCCALSPDKSPVTLHPCVSSTACMSTQVSNITTFMGEFKTKCTEVMNKVEEKVKYVCSTLEKLYLRKFSQTNQTSLKKLLSIAGEAFDQCMHDTGVTQSNTTMTLQGVTVTLQPQDYQTLKKLVKTECSGACQEITTALVSCSQNSQKDYLIDELFELSKFNNLKMLIILIVIHANPTQRLEKEKIEQKVILLLKQLIAANLSETEITDLINFFKSPAFQKILQHADEFIKLILDNLSPEITNFIQHLFPWHTIL